METHWSKLKMVKVGNFQKTSNLIVVERRIEMS